MKKDTNELLRGILKKSEDQNATTAILNLMAFEGGSDELTYESLLEKRPERKAEMAMSEQMAVRDERIRWMTFCNFRSVPDSEEGKHFGVNFSIGETPASVFLVGSNGTGKTTLYSALEHHYLSSSSLSKDMNLDEDKILTYGFGQMDGREPVSLKVQTMNGGATEERLQEHAGCCTSASFCSEYDLHQLGEFGYDLTEYVLTQLGYGELSPLIGRLEVIVGEKENEIKESEELQESEMTAQDVDAVIGALLDFYKDAKAILQTAKSHDSLFNLDFSAYSSGQKVERFGNMWTRIKNLTRPPKTGGNMASEAREAASVQKNSERANDLTKKMMKMYRMLEDALQGCVDRPKIGLRRELEKLYREKTPLTDRAGKVILPEDEVKQIREEIGAIVQIISALKSLKNEIINNFKSNRFPMIKNIMETFSNNDGEMYLVEGLKDTEGKDILRIEVRNPIMGNDAFHATPQEFYNSFRYKLYAVSFKIALALMEMKEKNIRVPLVIDDVFNASDFENNIRLEYFVHNVYKAYDGMDMQQPLQLILLTHDEMVQSAFRKGAELPIEDENDGHRLPHKYICGRLFSHRFAKRMFNDIGEEDNLPFYNLYIFN